MHADVGINIMAVCEVLQISQLVPSECYRPMCLCIYIYNIYVSFPFVKVPKIVHITFKNNFGNNFGNKWECSLNVYISRQYMAK